MNKEIFYEIREQLIPDESVVDDLKNKIIGVNYMKNNNTRKFPVKRMIAIAAVIVVLVVLAISPVGAAAAKMVRDWFTPKNTSISLEGESSDIVITPDIGKVSSGEVEYVIYVDEESFAVKEENGVKTIYGKENPDAAMTITHKDNVDYDKCLKDILAGEAVKDYEEFKSKISYKNSGATFSTGSDWDDIMTTVVCISDGRTGCFVVRYSHIVEAAEGFGTRFAEMLKTFEIGE